MRYMRLYTDRYAHMLTKNSLLFIHWDSRMNRLLICLLFSSSCAHRSLQNSNDALELNKLSREYKTGYIYFFDSTRVKASSIQLKDGILTWIDSKTGKPDRDTIYVIRKVGFYDRSLGSGVGGLLGAGIGAVLTVTSFQLTKDKPIEHVFQMPVAPLTFFAMALTGSIGGFLGYSGGYPFEFVNTDQ